MQNHVLQVIIICKLKLVLVVVFWSCNDMLIRKNCSRMGSVVESNTNHHVGVPNYDASYPGFSTLFEHLCVVPLAINLFTPLIRLQGLQFGLFLRKQMFCLQRLIEFGWDCLKILVIFFNLLWSLHFEWRIICLNNVYGWIGLGSLVPSLSKNSFISVIPNLEDLYAFLEYLQPVPQNGVLCS